MGETRIDRSRPSGDLVGPWWQFRSRTALTEHRQEATVRLVTATWRQATRKGQASIVSW
jgi:hypothetical protein